MLADLNIATANRSLHQFYNRSTIPLLCVDFARREKCAGDRRTFRLRHITTILSFVAFNFT